MVKSIKLPPYLRPVCETDAKALLALAAKTGFGLTTLPNDPDVIHERIETSERAFSVRPRKPGGETYLFVLCDPKTDRPIGTTGFCSKVGGFEPFYAYQMRKVVHESPSLGVYREIEVLDLVEDHNGPAEIGTLFLSPKHRGRSLGRLLSLGRFLFLADQQNLFDKTVIAEMRGVIDARGRSPFWESLGRHFFGIDFHLADRLVMKDKRFIAELMPRHPIYIPLLPASARRCVNKVHPDTEPALKLLLDEGFERLGMVDIFEGGPVVSCPAEQIRTVRQSHRIKIKRVVTHPIKSHPFLIANTRFESFRACMASLEIVPGHGIVLDRATTEALQVDVGDPVRISPMRPGESLPEALK